MGLKKCPICGEKYADIYKRCPFCEEDENPSKAKQPRRYDDERRAARRSRRDAENYEEYEDERERPIYTDEDYDSHKSRRGRRAGQNSSRGRREELPDEGDYEEYYDDDDRGSPWFRIIMVVLVAIIIACLLYLGRGVIGDFFDHGDAEDGDHTPPVSDVTEDPHSGAQEDLDEEGTEPHPGATEGDNDPADPNAGETGTPSGGTTEAVTGTLTLSTEDVSIQGDETFVLSAASGSGTVTYESRDPKIASVSASGTVKGLSKGKTEIVVRRGSDSAVCIVRVKSNGAGASSGEDSSTPSETGSSARLSHTDVTMAVGETCSMKVSGVSEPLSWSVGKSSVATVDANGVVTAVGSGKTTVTVSWGSEKRECIVRVK